MKPRYNTIDTPAATSSSDCESSYGESMQMSDTGLSSQTEAVLPPSDITPYQFRRWCGVRRSTCLLSIYIFSYIGYLFAGAFLMSWLETGNDQTLREEAKKKKMEFLARNRGVNATELEELIDLVINSSKMGISLLESDIDQQNWSIGQSILFTVTLVTTIGYGFTTPITQIGKLLCVLYGILGIPFTLVFLSASVQRLLQPTCKLLALFSTSKIGTRMSMFNIRLLHLICLFVVFTVFFVLIPAGIFWSLEPGWTYLDAFYFVFISLTTIGLGDYIPGDNPETMYFRDLYQICVSGYLLLGLIFMSLTLTVFYDIPQLNLGLHLHKHSDIRIVNNDDFAQNNVGLNVRANSIWKKLSFFAKGNSDGDVDEERGERSVLMGRSNLAEN